jgi:hypothetical protein
MNVTPLRLLDGYADFCKLLIVENFTDALTGTCKITNENYQWLRSGYYSRTDQELPVLTRALHLPVPAEKANYLVFVLYTRDHLKEEHDTTMRKQFEEYNAKTDKPLSESDFLALSSIKGLKFDLDQYPEAEYGVVSIMGQMINKEEPMCPATMTRNHLGMEFGGSGHPIDTEQYMKSVEFWENHALIK